MYGSGTPLEGVYDDLVDEVNFSTLHLIHLCKFVMF